MKPIEAGYSEIEIKVAQEMAFAGRARNDVSEDALEYWLYTGDETKAKDLKQARAAIAAYTESVSSQAVGLQFRGVFFDGTHSDWTSILMTVPLVNRSHIETRPVFSAPPPPAVPDGFELHGHLSKHHLSDVVFRPLGSHLLTGPDYTTIPLYRKIEAAAPEPEAKMSRKSSPEKEKFKADICPTCGNEKPFVNIDRGSSLIGTQWYRERISCRKCNLKVSARTPGRAFKVWNSNVEVMQ